MSNTAEKNTQAESKVQENTSISETVEGGNETVVDVTVSTDENSVTETENDETATTVESDATETVNETGETDETATGNDFGGIGYKPPLEVAEGDVDTIEYNDTVMMIDRDTATMIAEEGLISYRFLNMFESDEPNAKVRSTRSLTKNPPTLEFFTIDKETAEPVSVQYQLTRNVTENMAHMFTQLNKAYQGTLYTGSDEEIKNSLKNMKQWAVEHKIKATLLSLMGALFVALIIYSTITG